MSLSSRVMILLEWLGAQLGENFANHSRATASKLSDCAIFSAWRLAPGSIPSARSQGFSPGLAARTARSLSRTVTPFDSSAVTVKVTLDLLDAHDPGWTYPA